MFSVLPLCSVWHSLHSRSSLNRPCDPCFCSIFLTNVGSFGLDSPFHHLYERGNCPIFLSVGKVTAKNRLEVDGSVSERKALCLRYSFDDRIADGTYMGKTLELMRRLIEEPEPLAERPEIDPAHIAQLMLVDPQTSYRKRSRQRE